MLCLFSLIRHSRFCIRLALVLLADSLCSHNLLGCGKPLVRPLHSVRSCKSSLLGGLRRVSFLFPLPCLMRIVPLLSVPSSSPHACCSPPLLFMNNPINEQPHKKVLTTLQFYSLLNLFLSFSTVEAQPRQGGLPLRPRLRPLHPQRAQRRPYLQCLHGRHARDPRSCRCCGRPRHALQTLHSSLHCEYRVQLYWKKTVVYYFT